MKGFDDEAVIDSALRLGLYKATVTGMLELLLEELETPSQLQKIIENGIICHHLMDESPVNERCIAKLSLEFKGWPE